MTNYQQWERGSLQCNGDYELKLLFNIYYYEKNITYTIVSDCLQDLVKASLTNYFILVTVNSETSEKSSRLIKNKKQCGHAFYHLPII